jgi:hypothetical protein
LVLSKFVFGIVSFVALMITVTVSALMIAAPLVYDEPGTTIGFLREWSVAQYSVGPWVVDTLPEALAVAAGGVVFLILALNLLNGLARLHAQYTATLLRVDDPSV